MKQLKNFPYERALVVGLAKSGFAAAAILQKSGVRTTVNDLNTSEGSKEAGQLKRMGVSLVTGSHPLELLDETDVVVKNPGIPYENELIAEAVERGITVVTEVELTAYLHEGPVIGITGSNGKTTTTTLVHRILEADNRRVHVAGNIGEVACEVAQRTDDSDIMVIELSSFQLLGIEKFRADVAVWLNLFDSHLDYHKTRENYQAAKANILNNQSDEDCFVYNADDRLVESYKTKTQAKGVPFSLYQDKNGAWADDSFIYYKEEIVAERGEIVLVGEHNIQNCLAAVAACKCLGVSNEAVQAVLYEFAGVSHRLQYVDKKYERFFYNDSKATNIRATSHALQAFPEPVVLLAGGLDRGNAFDELIPYLPKVKHFVLFGETAGKLEALARDSDIPFVSVETMEDAVEAAYRVSLKGDVILLSPACASWDQYRTFEERGNKFIAAVHKL
ncbi:UDP-N-acetylmuramoyl-L-alanine--D-glutamate ligase [Salimicrobium halophilum]|uniref:UDP-N-acetylmuramoylalanine--D-glutamate ligase n=1 Tax=Salimicrobium halophilum TaxID=86666 RepID=A0A1G8QFL1_9BACI|nr:UDP-N-acetylmuramoyl-L-alanine--D-glutamate ligase [Salimicrobium halophilum]SDJ03574.1 UDP-N-acetylmuramoylalanine--D-glutamate ligase [Salimicrobium halophilum]